MVELPDFQYPHPANLTADQKLALALELLESALPYMQANSHHEHADELIEFIERYSTDVHVVDEREWDDGLPDNYSDEPYPPFDSGFYFS